jgi:selenocysteine-specific elongation factor
VHDADVERAAAGQRVAVSLPGVERGALRRGDVLVEPGGYRASYRLDVALDELEPIRDGARLTVHHGTAAVAARVVRIGGDHAQLRLARPVVAARGDRVVLRAETTLGGGVVLDPAPPRSRDPERIAAVASGRAAVHAPARAAEVAGLSTEGLEQADGWVFSADWLAELSADLERRLDAADPLDPGVPAPQEPWAPAILPLTGLERRGAKLYRPGTTAELGEHEAAAAALEARLGLDPVKVDERRLAALLEERGRLVRVGDGFAVSPEAYARARVVLLEECAASGRITLARFRDLLGASRRTAQLLLQRFDADGLTRRVGDERVLRRSAREA